MSSLGPVGLAVIVGIVVLLSVLLWWLSRPSPKNKNKRGGGGDRNEVFRVKIHDDAIKSEHVPAAIGADTACNY